MNERIMKLAIQAREYAESKPDIYAVAYDKKFAELIIKDIFKEMYVVYPGGKRGSDVAFQNISLRDWVKQVYGVDA